MKNFPITIFDNFYENPDLVRQFALSLEFTKAKDGRWPGSRTDLLSIESPNFFDTFCNKLFNIFYDLEIVDIGWKVETYFQKIDSYSDNENDIKNQGWIHSDNSCIFSGVVYLNPYPKPNWGTSVYKLKSGEIDDCKQETKFLHYSESKDFDEDAFIKEKKYNNDKFIETVRIENQFNRMILFEGGVYHGVPSYYSDDEFRLTQVFFVNELSSPCSPPIVRSKLVSCYD